ncbi:retrovirus-related pol polyprotein from transposon TNT 1-94 [Tanacetum coccineum]
MFAEVATSSRMKSSTSASRSQPLGTTKNNRILRTTSSNMKNKVEDHPRSVKSKSNKMSHVIEPVCNANVKHTMLNVNVRFKSKSTKKRKNKSIWKPTGKVFTDNGYRWKPTGSTFTISGNTCPLTRITSTKVVPLKETTSKSVTTQNPQFKVDSRKPKITKSVGSSSKSKVVQIVLWYFDSGCSKHMTGNRSQLINFVHKFLGTVRFGNDQIAKIMGYRDYQMGKVMISWVYYVEGLGHNLFSIGLFCDSDLEVAFRKHTCYIRDLEGVDLTKGSRGLNLYTLSLEDMMLSTPIFLLSKASKTKSWLWHQSKNHSPKPKAEDSILEKLYLLHMDLCGPMRIQKFVNQTLSAYYEDVGISYQTLVSRTPQQNGVVKRRNQTLAEAALTMLIFSKALLFLWVEAVATACFTQN